MGELCQILKKIVGRDNQTLQTSYKGSTKKKKNFLKKKKKKKRTLSKKKNTGRELRLELSTPLFFEVDELYTCRVKF